MGGTNILPPWLLRHLAEFNEVSWATITSAFCYSSLPRIHSPPYNTTHTRASTHTHCKCTLGKTPTHRKSHLAPFLETCYLSLYRQMLSIIIPPATLTIPFSTSGRIKIPHTRPRTLRAQDLSCPLAIRHSLCTHFREQKPSEKQSPLPPRSAQLSW